MTPFVTVANLTIESNKPKTNLSEKSYKTRANTNKLYPIQSGYFAHYLDFEVYP